MVIVQKYSHTKMTHHPSLLTAEGFGGMYVGLLVLTLRESQANWEQSVKISFWIWRFSTLRSAEESLGWTSALQDLPSIEGPSVLYLQPHITKRQ